MMNKKRTSMAGLGKYALTLPLLAMLLLAAYACNSKKDQASKIDEVMIGVTDIPNDSLAVEVSTTPQPPIVKESEATIGDQAPPPPPVKVTKKTISVSSEAGSENQVFTTVDEMPEFVGGEDAFMKFILKNLHYPSVAKGVGIEGRVIIRFVISKTGEVANVEVLRGLDPACDKEAVRVAQMMPAWIPGKQNGKPVNVYFTLPIVYRLSK